MSSRQATILVNEAVRLDNLGDYVQAEAYYTRAIYALRGTLTDGNTTEVERESLMLYISDMARRTQQLRAIIRSQPSSGVSSPSPAAHSGSSTSIPSLDNKPVHAPGAHVAPSPRSSASPLDGKRMGGNAKMSKVPLPDLESAKVPDTALPNAGTAADTKPVKGNTTSASPPPPVRQPPTLRDLFAPRTSELVLKAIDVATTLNKQGEIKRAVDVLQHAYTVGSHERNNPSNFSSIEETLQLMRKRYYQQFPPRFLQDNQILPEEMDLLRKSGITNTLLLPIWDDVQEGYGAVNVFMPCEGVWEDNFTPKLGSRQVQSGARMMRINDAMEAKLENYTIIRTADPLNIKQTVVGDCSLVCSLIICASYQKRFPKAKIISSVIYPQDKEGNPIINLKGKYCVKMLINGITRIVTIDDRLPINPRTKQLLCTYSNDPSELWVSFMEKAFVKMCGGSYNFPGSSSSSDLYKLSGWLPDSFSFTAEDMDAEYQWRRIVHTFTIGAALLTLSTAEPLPQNVEKSLLLSGGHAYAVIDVREVDGTRMLMVRNPWSTFTWAGAYSLRDTSETAKKVHEALGYTKEQADLGVFCIAWEDVLKYFDRCSLSWNPYMLYRGPEGQSRRPVRIACHGTHEYTTSMGLSPQLHIGVVQAPRRTRMHLVFSRHITDVTEFGMQFEKDNPKIPFVGVKVYDVTSFPSIAQSLGGRCMFGMCRCRRLATSSDLQARLQPMNSVTYRNHAAHTVSFDCPAGTSNLVVVVVRQESTVHEPFNFTVTLHTELEMMKLQRQSADALQQPSLQAESSKTLLEANQDAGNPRSGVYMHMIPKTSLKYANSVRGAWVKGKTCGGKSEMNTFVFNPQYRLLLSKPAYISVRLSVDECEEPCMVHLLKRKSEKGGSGDGKTGVSIAARVGSGSKECDFCMMANMYGYGGGVLDSALPRTLGWDSANILGACNAVKEGPKIHVTIVGGPVTPKEFTFREVDEYDELGMLLLAAVGNGHTASPAHSTISVAGTQLPMTSKLGQLLALAAQMGSMSGSTADVQILLGRSADLQFAPTSSAGEVFRDVQSVCKDVVQCNSQLMSYVPRLSNLARRAQTLDAVQKEYLIDMCKYVTDFLNRTTNDPRPPPSAAECLPPIPAGEYTIVASQWKKGVPGVFDLTVETTEQHSLQAIPDEGAGLIENRISAQLLKEGGPFECAPHKSSSLLVSKNDALFRNTKVHVVSPSRCTFMCRLLMLDQSDGDGGTASAAASVNVSMFKAKDDAMMELIASSGPYTTSAVSVAPLLLEPKVSYLVVVSASKPSSSKYVLRIYSNVSLSARVTT